MRLKKLEIKGFKSFAKNTVIHFSNEVTGVVGPNGSGKSNVVDAIRWVLGEQKNKDLRLDKMADVLFNGTSKKSKAKMASVAITFENNKGMLPTEYSEVEICRMLYRSGQSEYRLNNVTCRLKDITTMLANTGIGSNSYAIIELGMVDDILTNKDNSRRRMFEQAAGIYHFKKRKKESAQKLKATNDDLERVEDLLHEINGNLRQLKSQARRAKKYMTLKERYREESIILASSKLSGSKERYAQLQEKIQNSQQIHAEALGVFSKVESGLEKKKFELIKKEEELQKNSQEYRTLTNEISDVEHTKQLAQQEITFAKNVIGNSEQFNVKNEDRLQEVYQQIKSAEQEMVELIQQVELTNANLEQAKAKKAELEIKFADRKASYNDLLSEQFKIGDALNDERKLLAVLENKLENTVERKDQLEQKTLNEDSGMKDLLEEELAIKESLEKIDTEVAQKKEAYDTAKENFDQLTVQLEKLQEDLLNVRRGVDARQHEHDLIKQMIDEMEGYPESIKFLAKQKSWQGRLILLSDLIDCDEKYKAAIEAALEPLLNAYVVDTESDAVAAIELLNEAQQGRASFICGDRLIEMDAMSESPRMIPDGWISAINVMNVTQENEELVTALMRDVYILPKNQNHEVFSAGQHMTLVHEDGHLVSAGIKMTGGSIGLFDGKKIGRKQMLGSLAEQIKELREEEQQLLQTRQKLQNNKENSQVEAVQAIWRESELNQARNRQDLNRLSEQVEARRQQQSSRYLERQELDEQMARLVGDKETAISRIAELQERHDSFKSNADSDSNQLNDLNQALEEFLSSYNESNILAVQAKHAKESKELNLNQLRQRVSEINRSAEERVNEIKTHEEKIGQNIDKIKSIEEQLNVAYQRKKALGQTLEESRDQVINEKDAIQNEEGERNSYNRKINEIQQIISSSKDQYNELRLAINEITQRTKVEFGLDTKEIMEIEVPEEFDEKGTEESVEKQRIKIYNFGEVNSLAVKAYDEMLERFNDITEQKNDILEAQKSLLETIADLEEKATERFMTAFDQVRLNFRQTFQTLFGKDDDCDLLLMDPENPLTSDIEILAKPKGKRPKSLRQLSGGEKTLTVTALLFGLYLLKPAPFCIFDEVDAPLDDTNIQLFNKIIQEFSGDSQFVIITHNKLTMAAVDVIYGIYMDEPGVSGVAPVSFGELNHDHMEVQFTEN